MEFILDDTSEFTYSCDLNGRLIKVLRNDITISVYSYDDNGNRLSYSIQENTIYGVYDDQDRLLC